MSTLEILEVSKGAGSRYEQISMLMSAMKQFVDNGDIDTDEPSSQVRKELDKFFYELRKLIAKPDHTAAEINRLVQNSVVTSRMNIACLPEFITDTSFFDTFCSLKIFNRVKFKESILNYSGAKSSLSKDIKKKDEQEMFLRSCIFYGCLEESYFGESNTSINQIYNLAWEYNFIQFGLRSIGVDCPVKHNEFISMCSCMELLTPAAKQIYSIFEASESIDNSLIACAAVMDYVFAFLGKNTEEQLTKEHKNGIIAFMSGFGSLYRTDIHYLYAISYGHDWLLNHSYYYHNKYRKEPNENISSIKIRQYSFASEGMAYKHLMHLARLIAEIANIHLEGKNGQKYMSVMEFLLINSHCFFDDLHGILEEKDKIINLTDIYLGEAIERALNKLSGTMVGVDKCELNDEFANQIIQSIKEQVQNIEQKVKSASNKSAVAPLLKKSVSSITTYTKNDLPSISEQVGILREKADACLKSMDVDGARQAIEGLGEIKKKYSSTISSFKDELDVLEKKLDDLQKKSSTEEPQIEAEESVRSEMAEYQLRIKQLEKELAELNELAAESDKALMQENAKLQAECSVLKSKLSAQSNMNSMSDFMTRILFSRPSKPTTIDVVKAIKDMFPNVIFADNVEKVAESNIYDNPLKLFDYLVRICNEYYHQIKEGAPDAIAKNCLGTAFSAGESETTMQNAKARSLREFPFHGKKISVLKHITIGNRNDKRQTVQVFFDVFDGNLHIGYIGEHLPLVNY